MHCVFWRLCSIPLRITIYKYKLIRLLSFLWLVNKESIVYSSMTALSPVSPYRLTSRNLAKTRHLRRNITPWYVNMLMGTFVFVDTLNFINTIAEKDAKTLFKNSALCCTKYTQCLRKLSWLDLW